MRSNLGVLATVAAGLIATPSASAVTPVTPATCGDLTALFETAGPGAATLGEVAQMPAGVCKVNLTATHTNVFTLEGASGGGTTLERLLYGRDHRDRVGQNLEAS